MATIVEQAHAIVAAMSPQQKAAWKARAEAEGNAFRAANHAEELRSEMNLPEDTDRHATAGAIRFVVLGHV